MNELSYTCTSQSIVHNIVLLINFRLEETNLFYLFCNKHNHRYSNYNVINIIYEN